MPDAIEHERFVDRQQLMGERTIDLPRSVAAALTIVVRRGIQARGRTQTTRLYTGNPSRSRDIA